MAVEKVEKVALTAEDSFNAGFFGTTNSYPNEFHEASGEAEALRAEVSGIDSASFVIPEPVDPPKSKKGVTVNSNDAPKPTGGTSGPGAKTDTSEDDKK